ncbi:hypothetical protein [Actinomadura rayongensis]|uniref:Uncharacterized protein n=1 Tax=Actinomadura rayongensis TaxID=1429076 RepID=A0A6I4W899_9ACTN|nr:hypothetical protein [Actinomadura rayongensis]MXQ65701.1 hypothetical protein [Actinomadura rayongensis]
MSDAVEQAANRLLKGIVSDELLGPYVRLLQHGGCSPEEAADLLGGVGQVEALRGAGMAHVQPPSSGLAEAGPLGRLVRVLSDRWRSGIFRVR